MAEGRERGDWGGHRSSLAGKNGGYGGEGALPYMKERRIIWRSQETSLCFFFNLIITHLPLIKRLKLSILSFKKNGTSHLLLAYLLTFRYVYRLMILGEYSLVIYVYICIYKFIYVIRFLY